MWIGYWANKFSAFSALVIVQVVLFLQNSDDGVMIFLNKRSCRIAFHKDWFSDVREAVHS